MNLSIKTLPHFDREVKKLFKKYKQLPADLKVLKTELLKNPKSGIELGNIDDKVIVNILKENGLL